MIYELTKENLLNAGLNETDANKLFNTIDNYTLQCNEGNFFVSKPKNKFYTGVDFWRESYFYNGNLSFPFACPELMSEYYNLAITEFLEKQKELFGTVFNEKNQTENFIKLETKRSEEIIKEHKDYIELYDKRQWKSRERIINILETYIQFLENPIKSAEITNMLPTFLDFINNVKDKEIFANDLKGTFTIETKTEIAIIIDLFEKEEIFVYSKFAPFYREIKKHFNREIGNQNTINDAIKRIQNGTQTREREFEKITIKVNRLIKKHKGKSLVV